MRTAWTGCVPGTWKPFVHAVCPHNECAALLTRTMGPLPDTVFEPVGAGVRAVFGLLARLAGSSGVSRWSHLQTALTYRGRLGRRYLEAERSLRMDGCLTDADSTLRPFLKAEKFNAVHKFLKPRMIFPRSARYNLSLASRLKPLEHWLWGRLTAPKVFKTGSGRVVAKGLNQRQRANLIVRKFRALTDCVACEVDGRAFEAHVGPHQLRQEHRVYRAAFPGDKVLSSLLDEQLVLRGRLSCGAKFSRPGGRASGDFNTGMGNSLIMLAVVGAVLRELCPGQFDLLVDGDNALVFLPRGIYDRVMGVFASRVLEVSGHEVQLDSPVSVLEEIRFGQSAPVYLGANLGWSMVRDYRKVVSGALSSHRWLREPTFAREWIRGVAACELSLARGVPVLQEWALSLQSSWGGPEGVRAHPHTDYFYQGAWFAGPGDQVAVSREARLSFARAFGLEPDAQLVLERGLGEARLLGWLRYDPESCDYFPMPPSFAEPWLDAS
jgi:hypothetical protein